MDPTPVGAGASSPSRGVHPRGALRALLSELDDRQIHATPRAVAVALWTFTNHKGGSWPSQRRLARMTGRCERTVRSAVKALETAGVIRREVPELRYRRARGATTVYRLLAGDAPPMTSTAPTTPPPSPSPELAAAMRSLAALVAAPPPELVFLPPVPLDLDGVADDNQGLDLVEPLDLDGDGPRGGDSKRFGVLDLVEPLDLDGVADDNQGLDLVAHKEPAGTPPTPALDLVAVDVPEAHEEPAVEPLDLDAPEAPPSPEEPTVEPLVELAAPEAPPPLVEPAVEPLDLRAADAPITGNGCRTRVPTYSETSLLARAEAPRRPSPRAARPPRPATYPTAARRSPAAPFRPLRLPTALPPPEEPRGAPEEPRRSPALAALLARCVALARRH